MKIFAIFAIGLLLVGTTNAWEIKNGSVNLTEAELLDIIDMSEAAGMGWLHGVWSKTNYDSGLMNYGEMLGYQMTNNKAIRVFNVMLEDHFNGSVVAERKLAEFSN